jgi:hypothetical protein
VTGGIAAQGRGRRARAERRSSAENGSFPVTDVPEVHTVISLILLGDFLVHGVVLQNRVFRIPCAPTRRAGDVSRETIFSSAAQRESARRCFT